MSRRLILHETKQIYSLHVFLFPTLLTSILFTCFWIDLIRVLATTGNTSAPSQAIRVYKFTKIQRPRFQGNKIIARYRKSYLHGTSFQSSPKINRLLIPRLICIQWKFTTPDHRNFANSNSYLFFYFRLLRSVHLLQSNQRFQAIELADRHVSEKL